MVFYYFKTITWVFLRNIKLAVDAISVAVTMRYLHRALLNAKTVAALQWHTSLARTVGITKDAK